MKSGAAFAAQGVQIAAGVPLECGESDQFKTFRIGLFGLDKLHHPERTVAHLLCDQLEFADLLLINKTDLVTEEQLGAVTSFLGKVNPTAEVVRTEQPSPPAFPLLLDRVEARISTESELRRVERIKAQWLEQVGA